MNRFRQITVYLAIVLFCTLSAKADFPEDIRLEKASYSKVTFSWLPPGATEAGISHYVIYRDGTELDETNELFYTDETVQPGTRYVYSVLAVMQGGQESDFSNELLVQTLTPSYVENNQLIEEIVDGFHDEPPSNLNAISLFSAVKAGFEALLGTNLFFSVVDENIVTAAMSEELAWINAVTPEPTEAERLEAQAEIDELMESSFAGNSFDHMYINQQLTQLGDRHWNAGNRIAAGLFYEFSLNYLSNHEPTVFHTLSRLAYFSRSHLTQDSSRSDISESLSDAKAYLDSFFDFFPSPDVTSRSAKMALAQPVGWYFNFFPKMLDYSNYDALYFSAAMEAAECLEAFDPDDTKTGRILEKIAAWELLTLQLRFVDESGNPRTGRVRIRNVSAENGRGYLFPGGPWDDERDFALSAGGLATVPVYAGHDYSISLKVDVDGGNELQFELPVFRYGKNRAVSFDYPTGSYSDTPSSLSRVDFVISSEAYPYNLRADRGIDVFDLSWDWVAPGDFETAGFKVYRGNREVASVTGQTARLPLVSTSDEYGYRVVAFNTDGNASVSSQILYVYPDDLEEYSDFFEWMDCYFGDRPVYASDDPDGDGVDNYHEFLNGTDPTRIPGPMPYAGPRGFNELTLEWEPVSDVAGAVYQISRNGNVVGTSATTRFTDSDLVPGVSYSYKVKLLEPFAAETDWGLPNTFCTQKTHGYEHADKVQQVVDRFLKFDIPGYTGPSLLSAVRSAIETLTGSAITFTVIRPELVEAMADQELALLREACPAMTTAERIAARRELDRIMEECWGGNSFEEMYINAKLTELAEVHWREYMSDRTSLSYRTAAVELLESSLFFLNNHEPTVRNTLAQLARYELQPLDADSTNIQIINALNSARDSLLRIYDYIPEPADEHSNPYRNIIFNYKKFFPRLLAYDTYDQALFDSVLQLAAVYRDQNIADARRMALYDEIAAWQLAMLTVTGGAANGTITFENVTPRYPAMPWGTNEGASRDSRTFPFNGTPLTVPVHSGHTYDVTIRIPVAGGEDWVHTVSGLKFGPGTMTTDNPFAGITIEDMPAGNDSPVFAFPVGGVAFPYNLAYEKFSDSFTLSWLYVPADGSTVDHYNIYRGSTLVATSTGMTCTGIPLSVCDDAIYTYSVSAVNSAGVESARSPIVEVLPDFTEEEQRYFEWKRLHFGNTAVLATGDSDGDGLTNYQEFLLGSNPGLAPSGNPRESISDILPGGTIRYYSGPFSSYPDFESLSPYKTETVRTIGQSSTEGEIFNSGSSGNIAVFISGYFDIAVPGIYRFNLNANGGAELTLDKAVLISLRNGGNNDRYADVYLETGTHLLELGFFRKGIQAALQLSWAGPDFSRTVFGSALWHTDEDDALLSEAMSWQRDSDFDGIPDRIERSRGMDPFNPDTDGDGLTDSQELYVFFTSPTDADTDDDGMDDWEEAVLALSNPLAADFSGEPQVLQDLSGIDFSTSSEGWYSHGYSVECLSRNGYISYPITLASKGMYVLEVTGKDALASTAEALFSIDLEIAGTICKSRDLISTDGEASTIRFYLPLLSAGTYDAKLVWNNIDQDKVLRINQVRLLALDGPDINGNSVPDWIDHRLVMQQQNNIPAISLTSPLCIEGGKGAALADIQVLSFAGDSRPYLDVEGHVVWTDSADERVVDGELTLAVPAVLDSVKGQFYANVELSPETVTEISIDRNGCETVQNVEWKDTNVLYTPSMTIRRGDALLLSVRPQEDISGSAVVTIGRDRLSFASETVKIPYRFNYAGTFTVHAEFTSAGGAGVSGEMTVNVIEASFSGMPYSIAGIERSWQNARIPVEAELESDAGIMIFRSDSASGANVSFCGNTPGRFNIVARLGDKGPVMAAGQLCILDSSTHKADGYYKIIDTFDDGTKLIEGKILLSEVPEDLNIRLAIYTTGTTFLDGTLVRTLTAADFDENGVCRYQMLKTDGSPTSTCHGINFYQGSSFLFSYQN